MTTKITVTADIPEYQRETHHVRVTHFNLNTHGRDNGAASASESHHVKLKHGETTEGYVYDGRQISITEEPNAQA